MKSNGNFFAGLALDISAFIIALLFIWSLDFMLPYFAHRQVEPQILTPEMMPLFFKILFFIYSVIAVLFGIAMLFTFGLALMFPYFVMFFLFSFPARVIHALFSKDPYEDLFSVEMVGLDSLFTIVFFAIIGCARLFYYIL